jgi:hypothetical protein
MRTQNPPPLKACRFDSDLGHHVNIRFGQSQVTAAAESNNLNVLTLFLNESAFSSPQLTPAECYSDDLSPRIASPEMLPNGTVASFKMLPRRPQTNPEVLHG